MVDPVLADSNIGDVDVVYFTHETYRFPSPINDICFSHNPGVQCVGVEE